MIGAATRRPTHWWPLVGIVFCAFIGYSTPLAVLPGDVRDRLHGSDALVGLVIGAFPVFALLGRFLAGWLADRHGRRIALQLGLLVGAIGGALLCLDLPAWALVATRGLQGLSDALVYTAAAAWVIDVVAADRHTSALALLGSGVWAGYAIGPLVGAAAHSRATVGVFIALLAIAGLPITMFMARPMPGVRDAEPFALAFVFRVVRAPGLAIGLLNVSYAAVVGFLVLHLASRGGGGAQTLAVFSGVVLLGRIVVVPFAQRLGLVAGTAVCCTAMLVGIVMIGESEGTVAALAGAVLLGAGYSQPYPTMAALVAGKVPAAGRARALGSLVAIYDACVGLGAVGLGRVSDAYGTTAVFRTAAVVSLVGAVIALRVVSESSRGARAKSAAADLARDAFVMPDA